MSQNHKHRGGSSVGNIFPHFVFNDKVRSVGETPQNAFQTNIVRTRKVIDKGAHVVHHEDTSLIAHRKIRVLLIITGLASGGATNVVLDIAKYFAIHPDFDIQLLAGPIPEGRTDVTHLAYELSINFREIPSLINHIDPITNMKAVVNIRRIIVQGNYDIVHTHSSVAGVVGRLAAISAGVPVIIHHVHGWGLKANHSRLMRMFYLKLERIGARFTDRIIAVSRPDIQKGLAHRIGREDKYTLIHNGIDLDKFRQSVNDKQVREELGLDPDCKLVGTIGRLDEQKNPLDFIRTADLVVRRFTQVQFLIVGDGSLRPECERLITELNLKKKFFLLGHRNDVSRILSILTISAMSSLWEGLPLAFLESMSAGKPIVANDVDGAKDVVINGETGFLVRPRQPSEMADRILYLLNNEKLCNKMGHVAQQRSSDFSAEKMVRQIESLYGELCSVRVSSKHLIKEPHAVRVSSKSIIN